MTSPLSNRGFANLAAPSPGGKVAGPSPCQPTIRMDSCEAERCEGRRRSPLRQTLVEAERGLACGLRRDSSMVVHFFTISLLTMTAMVLGLAAWQWVALALVFSSSLGMELIRQALRILAGELHDLGRAETAERIDCLATAALMTVWLGGSVATCGVFAVRIRDLYLTAWS
ncbi:MAG: diacylglycerol kinase [Planctomycetaceae bacterium]|nr:diacylglycerol kinase [Planctomycetaceae bacterium]